jgi:iron(III) transport system permease protein
MGAVSAWLVAIYDFPLRRLVEVLLVLPLALPTYLAAFIAVDLLDFFGPVQGFWRALTGARSLAEYRFPEIRSLPGAVLVMALVLAPYVYVPCRLVFLHSGRSVIDAARLLGARGPALFLRVGLPVARPAILAGLLLALLETINDVGATEHLGVSSLSVAIRDIWLNRSDLPGAARLAGLLVLLAALLALAGRAARPGNIAPPRGAAMPRPIRLSGPAALAALAAAALPALLGFVVPAGFLISRAILYAGRQSLDPDFLAAAAASAMLGAGVALAVALLAGTVAIAARLAPGLAPALRLTAAGYAIPGTVLVLALFPVLRFADDALERIGAGPLFAGTAAALGLALTIRFIGIGTGQATLALARLPRSIDWVGRVHGMRDPALAVKVHLPAMRPGLALGAILVFIDTVKELPATLLLRPLNFETLATRAYSQASAGTFEHAALDSLAILLLSGLAATLLIRRP